MGSGHRVMILDDERIVCDRLEAALKKLGFDVETHSNSEEAVERLASEHFDVLVTDLKMPGVGGMDVLAFARKHCPSTRVVVITGFATTDTARRAMELGAVEFIPKPFRIAHLRDLVVRLTSENGQGTPSS